MEAAFETRNRKRLKRWAEPDEFSAPDYSLQSELGAPAGTPLYLRSPDFVSYSTDDATSAETVSEEAAPLKAELATEAVSASTDEKSSTVKGDPGVEQKAPPEEKSRKEPAAARSGRDDEASQPNGQPVAGSNEPLDKKNADASEGGTKKADESGPSADNAAGKDATGKNINDKSPGAGKKASDKKAQTAASDGKKPLPEKDAGEPGTQKMLVAVSGKGSAEGDDDFETETADEDGAPVAVEPIDEPFSLDAVQPLAMNPLAAAYSVALNLPSDALRLPPAPPKDKSPDKAEQDRTAIDAARQAYGDVARHARQQHDSLVGEANATSGRIYEAYDEVAQRRTPMFLGVWSELDQLVERTQAELDAAFAVADWQIEVGWRQAKRSISVTTKHGHGRLAAAYQQAGPDIDRMLDEIFQPFKDTIDTADKDCADSGGKALTALTTWRDKMKEEYGTGANAVEIALNEAKLKIAPKMADDEIASVKKAMTEAAASYKSTKESTRKQVDDGAKKPLVDRREKISKEGQQAIAGAMKTALKQLKKQATEARKALRGMHANAVAQLHAQRRAARARLRAQARNSAQGTRSEASAAIRGVQGAVKGSLPAYERPVSRLGDNLKRSAERGTGALKNVARDAPPDVKRGTTQSRRLQADRLVLNIAGARGNFERHEATTNQDAHAELSTTDAAIQTAALTAQEMMATTAEQHASAFSTAADGIKQTADEWAKPMTVVFAGYVEKTRAAQKDSHKTWAEEVNKGKKAFTDWAGGLQKPRELFAPQLEAAASAVQKKLNIANSTLRRELGSGWYQNLHESQVTGALHGLTKLQGDAIVELFGTVKGMGLRAALRDQLWDADYFAAINYLAGQTVEGARWELKASVHWYNDEEERIENVMRSLSPKERKELEDTKMGKEIVKDVKDALGGTDLNVFNALAVGNDARADGYRMKEKLDAAREKGDVDAVNAVLAEYTTAPTNWTGQEDVTADQRRKDVEREFAAILGGVAADQPAAAISEADAEKKLEEYALKPMEIEQPAGDHGSVTITVKIEGAQHDRGMALIKHGEGSVEARAAQLGVEVQRRGGPTALNVDTALIDERLNPNNKNVSEKEKEKALAERDQVFALFAEKYGNTNQSLAKDAARELTKNMLVTAYGEDKLGAQLAAAYVDEPHLTPESSALAMRYAIKGLGTNEDLAMRTVGRMNRDEIEEMKGAYQAQTGSDLLEDLGVFGHKGWFTEFSGDEALQLEIKLLGVPRNAQEEAEVAFLQVQQQLNETGDLGKALASGTVADKDLNDANRLLKETTGGSVTFDSEGKPTWTGGLFNAKGEFTGPNKRAFNNAVQIAQLSAQNYAAKVDSYANAATMGIAIIGAIVAAVVTVATGGAASPLLLAAIAGITGLAGMAAHSAISGGRYGWEQAAVDLGMTAVQMLTAGVGASLGAASRGGSAALKAGFKGLTISKSLMTDMGRLTGSAFADMVLIGAATGGVSALGQTALSEQTWSKGFDHALDSLLEGLFRGALTGAATAAVSQAFEAIPIGKAVQGIRPTLGRKMADSSNFLVRGGLKAASSGLGGFAGSGLGLGMEKAAGTYHGDAGDIFQASLEAGAHSAAQGLAEGMAEAPAHDVHQRREKAREAAEAQKHAATTTTNETPAVLPVNKSGDVSTTETDTPPTVHAPVPEVDAGTTSTKPTVETDTPAKTLHPVDEVETKTTHVDTEAEATGPHPLKTAEEHLPPSRLQGGEETGQPRVLGTLETPEQARAKMAADEAETTKALAAEETDAEAARLRQHEAQEKSDAAELDARRKSAGIEEPIADLPQKIPGVHEETTTTPGVKALDTEGAAARLLGTEMQLSEKVVIKDAPAALKSALAELTGLKGDLGKITVHTDPDGVGMRVSIPLEGAEGGSITVRVVVGETERGDIASFRPGKKGENAEFVVTLSAHAHEQVHARALAHEFAEIRALSSGAGDRDVLRAGAELPSSDQPVKLSAHDQGRLAEIEVLSARLKAAQEGNAPAAEINALRHEAELLMSALGLVGDKVPARRLGAVRSELERSPEALSLVDETRVSAKNNAFLTPLTGEIGDMNVLSRQIEQARAMGNTALEDSVMNTARQIFKESERARGANDALFSESGRPAFGSREAIGNQVGAEGTQARKLFDKLYFEMAKAFEALRTRQEPKAKSPLEAAADRHKEALDNKRRLEQDAQQLRKEAGSQLGEERKATLKDVADIEVEAKKAQLKISEIQEELAALRKATPKEETTPPKSKPQDEPLKHPLAMEGEPLAKTLAGDPLQEELVRQRFADYDGFQDWAEFRNTYYETNSSRTRGNEETDAWLFNEWRGGKFVDPETGRVSALKDLRVIKPAPEAITRIKFEVELDAKDLVKVQESVPGDVEPTIKSVPPAEAEQYRKDLLKRRSELQRDIEFDNEVKKLTPEQRAAKKVTELTPAERQAKEADLSRVFADLTITSEALGVAAGKKIAEAHPEWTLIELPRSGSGVPDLVYRKPDGTLVLIECKGPRANAEQRTAQSGDLPVKASQGTPQYLESLAKAMIDSGDPVLKPLGRQMLEHPESVDYFIVKQTADSDENLTGIDVKKFDMTIPGR